MKLSADDFVFVWAAADAAGRVLREIRRHRSSGLDPEIERRTRQILRGPAVITLRALWQAARRHPLHRVTIAARIHCWLETGRVAWWTGPAGHARILETCAHNRPAARAWAAKTKAKPIPEPPMDPGF